MAQIRKPQIDTEALCKRYRTNVKKMIRLWKDGHNDVEVASLTGTDLIIIKQIKTDIELAHRRLRLNQKKEALAKSYASLQHQIFFNPLL